MTSFRDRLSRGFLLLGLLVSALDASAEEQNVLYTVGTSTPTKVGKRATYLVFESEDTELLRGRQFAIYRKKGEGSSVYDYERQAVVGLQLNPAAIRILLARSVPLGEDLDDLDMRLRGMYGSLIPAVDLPREDRLQLVLLAAKEDPNTYENLYVLGRTHPGVALAMGTAFSETVEPGTYTYEIRPVDGQSVLGRVTVDTENPVVLPAPGPAQPVVPMERAAENATEDELVPSAKGHLNVSLRWAVPDELRRLGLLRTGFNVYRVEPTVADKQGWVLSPPAAGELAEYVANGKDGVARLNTLPILVGTPLSVAEAADPTDHKTIYAIDNNGRFQDDGVPFENGDQFYYYVAGRDLLGQDGEYSVGTLVTICDRLPPASPHAVQVENTFEFKEGAENHFLKLRWKAPKPKDEETIVRYYVYRWESILQMQVSQGNPYVNRVGVVDADKTGVGEFIDDGSMTEFLDGEGQNLIHQAADPAVPTGPDDYGKTFWYTVRAVDDSACEGNISGNSAPVFGVLRSRAFNGEAEAEISIVNEQTDLNGVEATSVPVQADDTATTYYYRCENTLTSAAILWTEFHIGTEVDGPQRLLARLWTSDAGLEPTIDGSMPKDELVAGTAFYCKVGLASGKTDLAVLRFINPKSQRAVYTYSAVYRQVRLTPADDTPPHVSIGRAGLFNPLRLTLSFPEGSAEYKVYRRLDDGPLTMLAQGLVSENLDDVVEEDTQLLLHDGRVSYYAQLFDRNGNPGPMVLLKTQEMTGRSPVPPPRLLPLLPIGTPESPSLRLRWFAPAYGVEQFLVFLAIYADGVAYNGPVDLSPHLDFYSQDDFKAEALYLTGRIGIDFVASPGATDIVVRDNSYFELEIPVEAGKEYTFSMESLSLFGRSCSERSNKVSYTWQQTGGEATGGVNGGDDGSGTVNDPSLLPWPVRSLPSVLTSSKVPEKLGTKFMDETYEQGVCIRIGEGPTSRKAGDLIFFTGNVAPTSMVYSAGDDVSLLPFVLYRRQVASDAYPTPRNTVYQVSPYIERIPHEYVALHDRTYIRDPFFQMFYDSDHGDTASRQGLYLRDTQPMIRGARYEYVLLHFDAVTGEPDFSIVLPAIDIPEETD